MESSNKIRKEVSAVNIKNTENHKNNVYNILEKQIREKLLFFSDKNNNKLELEPMEKDRRQLV